MFDRYGPGGPGGGHGPRGGFEGFRVGHGYEVWHWVLMAAVIAAVVLLVVFLIQRSRHPHAVAAAPAMRPSNDAALTEARMRYARGDISREEFSRVWSDLGGAPLAMDMPAPAPAQEPTPASAPENDGE